MSGSSPVLVRAGAFGGKTYASLLNPTPFPASVSLDLAGEKKTMKLAPFALEAVRAGAEGKVNVSGEVNADYAGWITERTTGFAALLDELKSLDPAAAPPAFATHLARAKELASARRYLEADVALGHGLRSELELRRRVLAPPQQKVPRLSAAPSLNGDLSAWPKEAADLQSTDASIGTHLFFTNQWEGPKDLSARTRLGHDGNKLYIGIEVKDDVLCAKDGLTLYLSPANYRQWLAQDLKYEMKLDMGLPLKEKQVSGTGAGGFAWTTRRTADGCVAEGSIDMAAMSLKSGSRIGWIVQVSDDDNTKGLANDTWARKSILLMPNEPAFAYYQDARSCGQLVLE
jgi:hypothetical protein